MGYANCCEALAKADVREQLKDIKIPVLVVAELQTCNDSCRWRVYAAAYSAITS